jgi:hypothetical protein
MLLLAWAAWWGFQRVAWWTPAGHDIARAVRGAIGVNENLLTPPQAYHNVPITPVQLSALSRRAQATLASYYTGQSLHEWRDIARRTLSPQNFHHGTSGQWFTHWRIDWIHLGTLTLWPGGATATASEEERSNGNIVDRGDYTFHLVHTSAGWRVDGWDFHFEPGYGP